MRLGYCLVPLALLVCSAPAQEDEGRIYFSLNSDHPVRAGESIPVRVQAQGIRSLDFRLYRVNDPVKFFRQLDEPHRFGGAIRPTPKARTPIEKFAAWKHRWHARARDVFRQQFTPDNRHSIRAAMLKEPAPAEKKKAEAKKGEEFAGVSVLNPQQLVRSWTQPIQTPNRWEAATVPVELKDKGLYVLEATNGKLQAYTILSVTDLAIVTKTTPGKLLVRAVDRVSGAPLSNIPIQVYDSGTRQDIARSATDPDGLLTVDVKDVSEEGAVVLAHRDKDFAVTTVGGYSLSTERGRNFMGYVYTDRPVYRPGHPVHFKAIVRNTIGAGYQIPDQSDVQVQVEDPEGKTLLKKKASLSKFGSVSGDLTLPADAAIGYYSVNVSLSGDDHEMKAFGGFNVEEYRKPEYEVKVTSESPRIIQGGRVKMNVDVKYYYGEPVAGASVKYTVHRYRWWAPWYETDEEMGDEDEEGGGYGAEQVAEETAKLDSQGHLTIDVPTTAIAYDAAYRVEARVTDSSNREVAGSGSFVATRGAFFISAEPERYVYGPGDPARFRVETRDYSGTMVPNVPFRIEVAPHTRKGVTEPAILKLEGRTGPDGKGQVDFPAPASASYLVKVSAADTSGRAIDDTSWLWVSGVWAQSGTADQRIEIIPDKKSYKSGDKATILLVTNVPEADVWLTLEGKTLYWSKFIHAKGGTATVEIPIESSHAPNVFVDATFLSNNTLYRGSKSLKVPPVEKQIQVEVQSSKAEYKPGEPAQYTVTAKDNQGKPVAAEFSLGVVDEAIYAVKKEAQPDILNVFYGRTWNRVGTDTSMEYYFYGEAGKRRMQLAQIRDRKSRAQLKPDKLVEPKIRKNFPDTAYWIADLKTGSDGRASTEVTFPDSLTTWRATARGVTEDTKVGGAVQRTIVRKNLMVTMATPRFFTEADEVTVPVLVRNYTAGELKVKVSLDAQGVQILSGATSEITVAPKGEGRVDYKLRANAVDKVVLTAKALTTQESDALELTFPVEPYGLKLIDPLQTKLQQKSQSYDFAGKFPSDAQQNWRAVTVHLTPSAAGAVFGALEYLITYPYGCTEQTMSSFLPNVVVGQALKELKLPANIDQKDLAKKVKAGLERLYDYQHEDGGWGWWKDDASDPFMTAYVTSGLKLAADAGYSIDLWRVNNSSAALAKMLESKAKIAPDTRAYMVYALTLAGRQTKPQVEEVLNGRTQLTNFGLALLGLTLERVKDPRAADIASELTAKISKTSDGSYWESNRDPMLDFDSENSLEATAFAVKFLSKQQPNSPLIDEATQWLVNHRDQGYYWASTKRTAFVIFGLTDVLKRSGELKPDYQVKVTVNGAEVLSKRFTAEDALSPQPVKIRVPVKGNESNPKVTVTKNGDGVLFASARWEYRSNGTDSRLRGDTPLKINRNYYRLNPVNEGGKIIYNMEPLSGEAKLGDLVAVRLSVSGQENQRYLLVEDPLPTGAEVVARDDLYQVRGQPAWWTTWWSRREVRDNRVSYFPWRMPKDGLEYVYLIRFTNAGAFKVTPARVEPMYKPGHLGWSQPATFEVHQ